MQRAVSAVRLAAASALVSIAIAGCAAGASPQPSSPAATASAPAASPSAAPPSASADVSASPSGPAAASGSPAASDGASAAPSGIPGADITVTGVEYAFAGIPDAVEAGTVLGFRNAGRELHEMNVFRLNDDVTQTLPELLALPEQEVMNLMVPKGVTFATPGEDAEDTVTVDEPGTYVMVCFVPVGLTELPEGSPGASPAGSAPASAASPGASGPAGVPHALVGMAKMFGVE